MNQTYHFNKHHNQKENVEIKWSLQQGLPQNLMITCEIIPFGSNEDIGYGPGNGATAKFSNGETFQIITNQQDGQWYYNENNENNQNKWISLEKKKQELNSVNENENVLYVEVINYNNLNEYKGFITEQNYQVQTQELGEFEDLYKDIENNIQNIFDVQSPVYLQLDDKQGKLNVKMQLAKGKKKLDFVITVDLKIIHQDQEVKNRLIKEMELQKQSQKLDQVNNQINKQEQITTQLQQDFANLQQQVGNQKVELQNIFSSQLTTLQNQVDKTIQQQQFSNQQSLENVQNQLSQHIQSVYNQLQNQCQQLIQQFQEQQKPKVQRLSLSSLQQQTSNIFISPILNGNNGVYEFEFSIVDDEANYSIGIISQGDLKLIERKRKSYFVEFPEGKLKTGQEELGQIFSYKLQVDEKVGLRVDGKNHFLWLVINDHPLPPVRISDTIEEFAFVVQSETGFNDIAQDPATQNQ